jgi:anaerobic magnesium-protoporphyrin IX monomethyl ester cyclase
VKVLFIYPNLHTNTSFNFGLASLSAALKEAGHGTALISLDDRIAPLPTDDELLSAVNAAKPGLIAFSVACGQVEFAVAVARKVKRAFAHVPLVIGGAYSTLAPEAALETGAFDYAVVGEGEGAILDLSRAIPGDEEAPGIMNVWARFDGRVYRNPVRAFADLDRLPPKDYGLFDFQRIVDVDGGRVGVLTARGCPLRCGNCFEDRLASIYQRDTGAAPKGLWHLRYHSLDSVMEEIAYLASAYSGIRMFAIEDEIFTYDKKRVKEFAGRYRKATDTPFSCNSHARFFDAGIAKTLASGGCRLVNFAVGAGSARVRAEVMRRPIDGDKIEAAFSAAKLADLQTSAEVTLGLPTETRLELDETVYLLSRLAPDRIAWSVFAPLPGGDAPQGEPDSARDLKVAKLTAALPWYVNAELADTHVRRLFSRLTAVIDNLDAQQFEEFGPQIQRFDALLHQVLAKAGRDHYSLVHGARAAVASTWKE